MIRWWNVATGKEMLLFQDAWLPRSHRDLFAGRFDVQADWNPGGRLLLWQERSGAIRVALLPTHAEIDAQRGAEPQAR